MAAFRLVALAYALLVLLIAPSWLAADEDGAAVPPVPEVETPVEVQDAVDEVEAQLPAVEPPAAEEAPPVVAQEDEEPAVEPEPKAKRAKAEKKEREEPKEEEQTAEAAASASVTIRDFEFAPATVTINAGDTVTWTNDGPSVHTATAEDGSFDTGILRKGENGSATFTEPGTVAYICSPHPFMKGKVVVQAASASPDGGGSGPGGSAGTGSDDDGGAVAGDTSSSDGGSGLPATGSELLLIALFGVATLAAGLLLRRRAQT